FVKGFGSGWLKGPRISGIAVRLPASAVCAAFSADRFSRWGIIISVTAHMSVDRTPTRSACLATTATALIALVAVASTMSMLPGGAVQAINTEARIALGEAPCARQIADAVAADARKLIGVERVLPAAAMAPNCQQSCSGCADAPLPHLARDRER